MINVHVSKLYTRETGGGGKEENGDTQTHMNMLHVQCSYW